MSSPRPIDADKAQITIGLSRALWITGTVAVAVSTWAVMAVRKLDSIERRLASMQASGWTVADQERQMNWLMWDNRQASIIVRDVRDVINARPAPSADSDNRVQ